MSAGPDAFKDVLAGIWRLLSIGVAEHSHPFHYVVVGTACASGCALRTMVLRSADPVARIITSYTDNRSTKYRELEDHPVSEWLLYDPIEKIQVRCRGTIEMRIKDDLAKKAWDSLGAFSKIYYRSELGPGTTISSAWDRQAAEAGGSDDNAFANFAVLQLTVNRIDWLHLHDEGHRRMLFEWDGAELAGSWVVP